MSSLRSYDFLEDLIPGMREELLNPPEGILLPFWPSFNHLVGGLRMHELSLLTSGTGTGKTTFLANLAVQAVTVGVGCYVASVEIGAKAFGLAMGSVVLGRDFNTGERFKEEDWDQFERSGIGALKAAPVCFGRHDDRVAPEQLSAEIREAHEKDRIGIAILDNLQFFSRIVSQENERSEQDRVIRNFVRIVKDIPVHVFLIVHARKGSGKVDNQRVEELADLKGSKTIVDEAWNVFALNRPKAADITDKRANPTDRELLLLKLRRRGRNVGKAIPLYFDNGQYSEPARVRV